MEVSQTLNLYITYVEKEGPFLKVWGQTEKNNSIYVEQFLLGASPQFEAGIGKVSLESLQPATLICAKYKDNKYYRARITNVAFLQEGFVEVSFLDYGNKDVIPCGNIRSLQNFPSSFISIPPLATGFIFAEAHCPGGGEWNDTIFENISKEIKYREVQCTLLIQATQYFLVKIFIGGNDLCGMLINRGLMQPISLQAQQAVLLSMSMQRQYAPPPQSTFPTPTGINTYKACTLEPGCQYPVYVSYVNDGPCHFSVQLKQSEQVLVMLMSDINTITLRLLEDIPIPGTICLARCQEDGNVCRAVVTNEVDNQFKVFYVDFGNYEVVPLDALYQIPFKYVLPKVMAIRFSLAGVEKSTVTLEMQCAFKQFVDNRLLHMKVLPTPTRTAIPKCELWDPETKTSALDVVNRAAQNAYPEPVSLNRGISQPVKISYVYSCNRFYVQLANKENELLKLMLDLQSSCQTNDFMDPSNIKVGLPCCALFEADQQWYRSEVVEVLGDSVKVRYIDYGNEELVSSSQLKIIDGEQLTVLRPQAIECCLNGYQNMNEDAERDDILEELILEGLFTMKVVEMTNKKALVELFDSSNYNVSSLLLDKLAMAKSQVSPMLVQAGNKIEHRKSFSPQNGPREQNFRQDRRPGHDNKSYDRTNDRNEKPWRQDNKDYDRTNDRNEKSWRQDNKDFRKPDKYSNENANERKSWRQDNKGFSPNRERPDRDRSRNRNDRYNKVDSVDTTNNWESTNDKSEGNNDDWNTPPVNAQHNSRENDFGRNKGRFDSDKENWNSAGHKGGFKKRGDFRKDGSELSSSGSEQNFHKGPRTSSRNDKPQFQKKFDKPRSAPFNSSSVGDESWNVSTVTTTIDAAPVTAVFTLYDVVGTESKVIISWFHNPGHFYCQLADNQSQFKTMMEEIQQFYKSRKSEFSVVGAPVIGLFPEDNVLYRAQVLDVIGPQYKVYYVDFGNVSVIDKVWPIEKKFMSLPAQAIVCSLSGIGPASGDWPDADNFSKYFDKDAFTCKFVNKDEEKTYVNLNYDDDIAKILIQEGLAVSIEQIIPDIEIPLLLGQQFRAIIKSINNLSDIIIALECGLALSCKMHNLETATETYEDILKGLLEQTVIVYVDNVIDSRLEVTLYDTEGSKLVIINPDEGAYDSVESLCPLLVLRSMLTGFVSYVDESSVFIQPTEYAQITANLLDQMYEFYDSQKQDLPIIPEEGLLYAVHSQDSNWYRAKVISFDDEQATVSYVDYGSSENVAFSELRELDDKFLEMCTLSIQVTVNIPTDSLVDKEVVAYVTYTENGWEGTVELYTPGESSATESAEGRGEAAGMAISHAVEELSEIKQVEEDPVLPETAVAAEIVANSPTESVITKGTRVIVSHIDTPNEFYLQLAESLFAIDELQLNLQEQVIEMPVLETPTAGVLCAAPYSGDQQWYRAEVLDADDDITTVRFVDYGNTDVIDNKTTEIKTLPPNLLSLAVYATRSSLKVQSTDEEWNANAMAKFESLANAEEVTAEFIDQDEKTNYVELYSYGENIKDILIQENLAVPMELSIESKSTCFLSHLNSPSEFWIQLENCVEELEWIAEQLASSETFPELEDLTPGTLCAALFPDDEMWYRARILSNTVAGIELLFIDYGNSCTSNSLRQLPEDLVVTAPLAQKCSLQRPEGIPYWTPQAISKFSEISADGQTIFTVHKISTGETSVVKLSMDGEDVASMLLPVTEDGYVKDIESLESLTLEKDGEILPETYKLEAMPGIIWNEESVEKLKELNSQGTTLFQIEFISNNIVRLYQNGNDIRTTLGGNKISSLNVSQTNNEDLADYETDENGYINQTLAEYITAFDEENSKIEDDEFSTTKVVDETDLENNKASEIKSPEKSSLDATNSEVCDTEDTNEINDPSSDKALEDLVQKDSSFNLEDHVEKGNQLVSPAKSPPTNKVTDDIGLQNNKTSENECSEESSLDVTNSQVCDTEDTNEFVDASSDKPLEEDLVQKDSSSDAEELVKKDQIVSPAKSPPTNKVTDDTDLQNNKTSENTCPEESSFEVTNSQVCNTEDTNEIVDTRSDKPLVDDLVQKDSLSNAEELVKKEDQIVSPAKSPPTNKVTDDTDLQSNKTSENTCPEESSFEVTNSQVCDTEDTNEIVDTRSDKPLEDDLVQKDSLSNAEELVKKGDQIVSPAKSPPTNKETDDIDLQNSKASENKCPEESSQDATNSQVGNTEDTNEIDDTSSDKPLEEDSVQKDSLSSVSKHVEMENQAVSPAKSPPTNKVADDIDLQNNKASSENKCPEESSPDVTNSQGRDTDASQIDDTSSAKLLEEDIVQEDSSSKVEKHVEKEDQTVSSAKSPPTNKIADDIDLQNNKASSESKCPQESALDVPNSQVGGSDKPLEENLVQKDSSSNVEKHVEKEDQTASPAKSPPRNKVADDTDKDADVISAYQQTEKGLDKLEIIAPPEPSSVENNVTIDTVKTPVETVLLPEKIEKVIEDNTSAVVASPRKIASENLKEGAVALDDEIARSFEEPETVLRRNQSKDSSADMHANITSFLYEEIEKALDRKDVQTSRPSSSCSGKIKHDDRILPGSISMPHIPLDLADEESKDIFDEQDDVEIKSRPQSASSGRIPHDERIVPAALSRPQSPMSAVDKDDSQRTTEAS